MNIDTGEIKTFLPGQPIPPNHVELGNLPDPKCPKCRGKGKLGPKFVGHKHHRQLVYIPCDCTHPVLQPREQDRLFATGAFGELRTSIITPSIAP